MVADSPIRVYSCFFKIPNQIEGLNNSNRVNDSFYYEQYGEENLNGDLTNNRGSFLQYSILRYEEFLSFLKKYTHEPRRLIDLSRLSVRKNVKKPISRNLLSLGYLPSEVSGLILLKDIDKNI